MSLPGNRSKSFIVPSLLQEGGRGAVNQNLIGTDLVIEDDYFLQFKMADRLTSSRSSEISQSKLDLSFLPYFRFNVKNSPNSHQFNALVDLASVKGFNKVFYISPLFVYSRINKNDDDDAFNDFWRSRPQIAMEKVAWIDFYQWEPNNPISRDLHDSHIICYSQDSVLNGLGYLFSERKDLKISKFNSTILKPSTPTPTHYYIDEILQILDKNSKGGIFWRPEIIEILKGPYSRMNSIRILQNFLLSEFNIFWIPSIKKEKK